MAEWTTIKTEDDGNSGPVYETAVHESGWEATVKWDGCVHLYSDLDVDGKNQYLHICNLPEFIKMLQSLEKEVESRVVR